mmetsp:Transcript_14802/g.21838  ORF Transcript_14802/g.21838 Transcript_14802/m.21838 type:complete len:403 (+) Transcript_14802:78-1286(+)
MLINLPNDIILNIAEMLSPVEIAQFASCSRSYRSMLPNPPLRIHILSNNHEMALNHFFFVSEFPSGRVLQNHESLKFCKRYRFWQFDFDRGHRLDLISHLPLRSKGFDLAFAAWQRNRGDRSNLRTWSVELDVNNSDNNIELKEGMDVPWGSQVGLAVGGDCHKFKGHACSVKRKYLSAVEDVETGEKQWCVFNSVLGECERMKIMRSDEYSALDKEPSTKTSLTIRATPVFYSTRGAFGFYSARSLEGGSLDFGRLQVNVRFELWTEKGFLHIKADNLSFAFVVPMKEKEEESSYTSIRNEHPLLEKLWNVNQNCMFPVKLYMAASANEHAEGLFPFTTLVAFSTNRALSDIGYCDEEMQKFIIKEGGADESSMQQLPFANVERCSLRKFHCVFTEPLIGL